MATDSLKYVNRRLRHGRKIRSITLCRELAVAIGAIKQLRVLLAASLLVAAGSVAVAAYAVYVALKMTGGA